MPVLIRLLLVVLLLGVTLFTAGGAFEEPTVANLVIEVAEMVEEADAEQDVPSGHAFCTSQQLYVTPVHQRAIWAPSSIVGDGVFRPPRASLS